MTLQACANIVHQADPARWRAAMAAPVKAREVLLPIYAANVEISRAPWVTAEPLIAEMRLQWWRDVLDEIEAGEARRHEVVDVLSKVLTHTSADHLKQTIDARRWDITKGAFVDADECIHYATDTTFGPMFSAWSALGGAIEASENVKNLATALGISRLLQAVLDLKAAGATVFQTNWTDHKTRALALHGLNAFNQFQRVPHDPAMAACIEGAGTDAFLKHIIKNPADVLSGAIPAFPIRSSIARAKWAWGLKPPV